MQKPHRNVRAFYLPAPNLDELPIPWRDVRMSIIERK